jgi:hypothetical protein
MSDFFNRTFRIKPEERGLVFTLGFIILVNSLALNVSDVVAVSGFLNEVSTPQILLVWTVDMLLIILTTGLQSSVAAGCSKRWH